MVSFVVADQLIQPLDFIKKLLNDIDVTIDSLQSLLHFERSLLFRRTVTGCRIARKRTDSHGSQGVVGKVLSHVRQP